MLLTRISRGPTNCLKNHVTKGLRANGARASQVAGDAPAACDQLRSSHTVCALQNSRTPKCDSSRPKPLFFTPPKVTRGSLAQ